jgi:hypothetical protein
MPEGSVERIVEVVARIHDHAGEIADTSNAANTANTEPEEPACVSS